MPIPLILTTVRKFNLARATDYEAMYLDTGAPCDFSTCQESEVPPKVLKFMHALRDMPLDSDEDEDDVKPEFEVTYAKGSKAGHWSLGVHEKGAPFNPSGHSYYFTETHYLGFEES